MNALWLLIRKEMRELLRPRYLLPLIAVPLMFVALGQGLGGVGEALAEQPTVGVVNNDDGEYGAMLVATVEGNAEVVYTGSGVDTDTAVERTDAEGGDGVIVIPEDFSARLENGRQARVELYAVMDSVSIVGAASSAKLDGLIAAGSERLTRELTGATPAELHPVAASQSTYLRGDRVEASPGALTSAFTTRFLFVPIMIMLVIIVSGQMVMNSMAVETENKTLETLLTMPVPRRTIVVAKLVGSAAIGLLGAGLYTASIYYYQTSFPGTGESGVSLSLSVTDYAVVGVAIFLALVGVLALSLVLGTFAGDRQGAQLLLMPLSVLTVVPMFVTLFADFGTLSLPVQAALFIVPFTHPIMAPKQLLFGDPVLVVAGIAYEAVFAVAMIAVAVRLFSSDRLVTGASGRIGRVLSRLQQ